MLVWQIAAVLFTLTLGGALWAFHPVGKWLFWFGFGALLSAWNFYALINLFLNYFKLVGAKINLMGLLIHTNMRLLFTGICCTWHWYGGKALCPRSFPGSPRSSSG